jgi:hypothetical protein
MIYLSPAEYEQFGLEATTPAAWATAASGLIDAHCRRHSLGVQQYTERLRVASGRQTVRVSYLPLAVVAPATTPIVSARGRYGLPRRGESVLDSEYVQQVAQAFSLPGAWTAIDVPAIDTCTATGELTLPINALGLGFNELEVTYNAGLAPIPHAVKIACAQIVRNALNTPALNVRAGRLEAMYLQYFADTLVDSGVRSLLAPWVAQKVG